VVTGLLSSLTAKHRFGVLSSPPAGIVVDMDSRVERKAQADKLNKRKADWKPPKKSLLSGNVLNSLRPKRQQPEPWDCPRCGRHNPRYWAHCPDCGPEVRRP
jgi:hypothetical protein